MKKVIKIFIWFIISLFILVALAFVFRNEILLQVIKMDQRSKMNQPYTMLELPTISDSIYQVLAYDFDKYARDPINYVISEFSNHDIIFLGENHRVKHDIQFAQDLIPHLYNNGIKNIGFEFALHKDSLLIKEVITNKDYFDQEKANQIIFNLSPFWGFKEYIDLFRSAWEFNKNLPDSAENFMIYGIMHDLDFSLMKSRADEDNDEIMLKVRKGVNDPELYMANSIINSFVKKNKKALVYCGIHHAFTGYEGHGNRVGVLVKNKIGDRTMTISLHYPWSGKKGFTDKSVYPVNGYIDAFIRKHKAKDYAFGINVNNNSFGKLIDTTSYYIENELMELNYFCDGYIYLEAFSSAEGVTIQEGFINRKNFKYARTQLPNPELRDNLFKYFGPKVLNNLAAMDADIKYRFRHLY